MTVKARQMHFYERNVDGGRLVYADRFPTYIEVLPSVLESADPPYVTAEGKRVKIVVANGRAVYQMQWEPQSPDQPVLARRTSSTWKDWR